MNLGFSTVQYKSFNLALTVLKKYQIIKCSKSSDSIDTEQKFLR